MCFGLQVVPSQRADAAAVARCAEAVLHCSQGSGTGDSEEESMCETLVHECWKLARSMSGCWTIMNSLSIQIKATSCVSAFCLGGRAAAQLLYSIGCSTGRLSATAALEVSVKAVKIFERIMELKRL